MRKYILIGLTVIVGGTLWYLFRPERLLIDRTVNEAFPTAELAAAPAEAAADARTTTQVMDSGQSDMATSVMAPPSNDPETISSGRFHSNAHETNGLATIYRLPDGRRVLRLTDFATTNGPDLRVYLVAADDVQDEDAAKRVGFVDLGELKGNVGDQNYEVPADVDLTRYRAVSVWCRRFSVNFGAAPLSATGRG